MYAHLLLNDLPISQEGKRLAVQKVKARLIKDHILDNDSNQQLNFSVISKITKYSAFMNQNQLTEVSLDQLREFQQCLQQYKNKIQKVKPRREQEKDKKILKDLMESIKISERKRINQVKNSLSKPKMRFSSNQVSQCVPSFLKIKTEETRFENQMLRRSQGKGNWIGQKGKLLTEGKWISADMMGILQNFKQNRFSVGQSPQKIDKISQKNELEDPIILIEEQNQQQILAPTLYLKEESQRLKTASEQRRFNPMGKKHRRIEAINVYSEQKKVNHTQRKVISYSNKIQNNEQHYEKHQDLSVWKAFRPHQVFLDHIQIKKQEKELKNIEIQQKCDIKKDQNRDRNNKSEIVLNPEQLVKTKDSGRRENSIEKYYRRQYRLKTQKWLAREQKLNSVNLILDSRKL